MLEICKSTAAHVMQDPVFPELAAKYSDECRMHGLPEPTMQFEMYRAMDMSGVYFALEARWDDRLIGFAGILAPVLAHYGRTVATMESLFIDPDYRKGTGAGIAMLRTAEELARDIGAPAILVSSPADGRLEQMLPHLGYKHSNTVFMRGLGHHE